MRAYSVAVVGATGLVGRTMLHILDQRAFPVSELRLFASPRSTGLEMAFRGHSYRVEALKAGVFEGIEFALFSAGSAVSHEFAPQATGAGTIVIDNSSQWRLTKGVPLIVPEVNPKALLNIRRGLASRLIANPNCSTIQLVVALKPLHDRYGIRRVVVCTYQSVTGAGHRGAAQLEEELSHRKPERPIFPHPIAFNTVFHDIPYADGTSQEEYKMVHETRKILGRNGLAIAATCVRVPVTGGHGEAVYLELEKGFTLEGVRSVLEGAPGIRVVDDPAHNVYPMPLTAGGHDEVFVGRLRRDPSVKNGLALWVVADNLRKGAATNAVQIAETLLAMKLV